MSNNRMKAAAEWFRNTVFKEEAIQPRAVPKTERLPSMLRAARSLESGARQIWQSREAVFLKQAKLLANYEDHYDYRGSVLCYYPTYQSLTDQELRGYFSWRTKLRQGDVRKTFLSFAFLYIYELLNQIGVSDPMDGYRKLLDFQAAYGPLDDRVLPYLRRWCTDYVVYYGLDRELLSGSPRGLYGQSVTVLEHIREQEPAQVIRAVAQLAPKWLDRSKFYAAYREDMDTVIVRVLGRMWSHYAARCKKTMADQYFGSCCLRQVRLFDTAVFCDPLKRRNYEYPVNEQWAYRCENGLWTVRSRPYPPPPGARLDPLLKTIDSMMRQEFGYRHPVKAEIDTKWILRIIQEEIQALSAEKKAAGEKKITIDYSRLARIRQDAALTREKLIVDEEQDMLEDPPFPETAPPAPEEAPAVPGDPPLTPAEYRLLQCLLYGGDTGWVQASGCLLSVLVDGINEKLYDTFLDSVLDDVPQVIEDYIDDLKEMVHP